MGPSACLGPDMAFRQHVVPICTPSASVPAVKSPAPDRPYASHPTIACLAPCQCFCPRPAHGFTRRRHFLPHGGWSAAPSNGAPGATEPGGNALFRARRMPVTRRTIVVTERAYGARHSLRVPTGVVGMTVERLIH